MTRRPGAWHSSDRDKLRRPLLGQKHLEASGILYVFTIVTPRLSCSSDTEHDEFLSGFIYMMFSE